MNDKVEITANKVEKEFELLMKRKQEIEMNKGDLIKDMDELDIKRKVLFWYFNDRRLSRLAIKR